MSPEIWEKGEYIKASDVYAFALIVYEIYTNQRPFSDLKFFTIPVELKKGTRPKIDKKISIYIRNLIERC